MNAKRIRAIQWFIIIIIIFSTTCVGILVYWYYRPNTSYINSDLEMETWDGVSDGKHNSNTDMIEWKGQFWMIHASSPFHLGTSESKLIIWKSDDAKNWKIIVELDFKGNDDIRDPKFANISNTLFIYALANAGTIAKPYKTVYCTSTDGEEWSDWKDIKGDANEGWLFWRPKSHDGNTWYAPAYWWEHGKSRLFKSTDGVSWKKVSDIYKGETNDETAIEFYEDGTMICTARLEGVTDINLIGDASASTLISVAKGPDYDDWEQIKSKVTRLDGPNLFRYDDEIYAIGRYEPDARGLFTNIGSFFVRKRTSLFLVEKDELIYLSDLPSAGDTTYAGVVMKDGYLYVSYYTSNIERDYTWFEGVILPTDIRIAKIKLSRLEAVADEPPKLDPPSFIKADGIILIVGLICVGYTIFIAIRREMSEE
ncbi:MAG: sialidase family protein [Promethearchaeota archaeon]